MRISRLFNNMKIRIIKEDKQIKDPSRRPPPTPEQQAGDQIYRLNQQIEKAHLESKMIAVESPYDKYGNSPAMWSWGLPNVPDVIIAYINQGQGSSFPTREFAEAGAKQLGSATGKKYTVYDSRIAFSPAIRKKSQLSSSYFEKYLNHPPVGMSKKHAGIYIVLSSDLPGQWRRWPPYEAYPQDPSTKV